MGQDIIEELQCSTKYLYSALSLLISIYLSFGSVGVDCVLYFTVVLSAPHPQPSLCSGLGPAQAPFLVPVGRFRGVHRAEILIQIPALAGA